MNDFGRSIGIPLAITKFVFTIFYKTPIKRLCLSIVLTVNIFALSTSAQEITYHVGDEAIADTLSGKNQEKYCADLKLGERRSVVIDRKIWYAPNRYVITRISDKDYLIDLNLEFRPTDDYTGEYQDEVYDIFSKFNLTPGMFDQPDVFNQQIEQLEKMIRPEFVKF